MSREDQDGELFTEQVSTKVTKTVDQALRDLFEEAKKEHRADSFAEFLRGILTDFVKRDGAPATKAAIDEEAVEELRMRIAAMHGDLQRVVVGIAALDGTKEELWEGLRKTAGLLTGFAFTDGDRFNLETALDLIEDEIVSPQESEKPSSD